MDRISKVRRSMNMSRVKSKDTRPELLIRRVLHKVGFRYRLHDKKLPGKPDLVLPRYQTVIFVNGCFWHNHNCQFAKLPSTRRAWWKSKLEGNRQRDENNLKLLREINWKTLVIWECSFRFSGSAQTLALEGIVKKTERFFHSRRWHLEITGS